MYDYCTGKIILYFEDGHNDSVNDISLDSDTSQLFSCSSDKSIIQWDATSGKINQKWKAGGHEIYSMCVIDNNNLLTGSTSIFWWNIKDQTIIKEFSHHVTEVTLLRAMASSLYFLSAASGESTICAWSLNKENCSINAVASFTLPYELQNIDINKGFAKDNPLLLTATTKSGALVLFQHVFNGKIKNVMPRMTLQVKNEDKTESESSTIPVISSKILDCAESCIIAYGPDENPIFESVNIFDCPKTLILTRIKPLLYKCNRLSSNSKIKQSKEYHIANGQTSATASPYDSVKRRKLKKNSDIVKPNVALIENIDFNNQISIDKRMSPKSLLIIKKKMSEKQEEESISSESESDHVRCPTDPSEMANFLIQGIEEENMLLANPVLHCNDIELIRNCVKNVPFSKLNLIILELSRRLPLKDKRYSPSLRKWLKEVLSNQLPYLRTHQNQAESLDKIKEYLENSRVSETLFKMSMLKGLLNIQLKSLSTSSSNRDEESLKS